MPWHVMFANTISVWFCSSNPACEMNTDRGLWFCSSSPACEMNTTRGLWFCSSNPACVMNTDRALHRSTYLCHIRPKQQSNASCVILNQAGLSSRVRPHHICRHNSLACPCNTSQPPTNTPHGHHLGRDFCLTAVSQVIHSQWYTKARLVVCTASGLYQRAVYAGMIATNEVSFLNV